MKNGLCYNCLGKHRVSECHSSRRCLKCGKKHHTTIRKRILSSKENQAEQTKSNASTEALTQSGPSQVLHSASHPLQTSTSCILLATAQVLIMNEKGRIMKIRALIDQGSEVTLISERAVQTLKLPRSPSSIPLIGVGEQLSNKTRGMISFKITSLYDNSEAFQISAHNLTKLTSLIPSVQITRRSWQHLDGLPLADPHFRSLSWIDLIIGSDLYHQIIKDGLRKGSSNAPIAQLTSSGWVISGPASSELTPLAVRSYHISMDSRLYDLLHRFWQLKEISTNRKSSIASLQSLA